METGNRIIMAMAVPMTVLCGIGMFYNPFLGLFFVGGLVVCRTLRKENQQ